MRMAGLAVFGLVVAAPGRPIGCNGPDEVTVQWTFPDGPGDHGVDVLGCLDWDVELTEAYSCDTGSSSRATMAPGWSRCAVRGWRQDGALRVEGPVVRIDPRQASQVVDLGLPAGPIAGMGAQIRSLGGAIRVEQVVPGGPAHRAGIGPGDLILEVDGAQTAGMSSPEFVRVATGSPDTLVSYHVRHRDGRTDALRLLRKRIPANWESASRELWPDELDELSEVPAGSWDVPAVVAPTW
jgi:membrane-associated protease RseP (regulator of RpoE activity)